MNRLALILASLVATGCLVEQDPGAGDPVAADEPAAGLSRKATITCEFGADPAEPEFVFGTMSFGIDLDAKKVPVSCVAGDCILDGDDQTMSLLARSRWENNKPSGFSAEGESNVRQLIIDGSTGDDLELTFYISYFPERVDGEDAQAMFIINDGQFINGSSPVSSCTSSIE